MANEQSGTSTYAAFSGSRLLAHGELRDVARAAWEDARRGSLEAIVVLADETGRAVDLDLRGSLDEVLARLTEPSEQSPARRVGPGRPKLGVVSREVSLLPRHWEWLSAQPGGASVALRKLVEVARKQSRGRDEVRRRRDAAHAFMWAMAGNFPGFEEASRAFFAADYDTFDRMIEAWPEDVRDHARRLVAMLVRAEAEAVSADQG